METMIRPVAVEAREGFRLWLRFSDGAAGEVDLSHLAGRGVFAAWDEAGGFERAFITPHRAIGWGGDIELCADALYLQVSGKGVEEVMAGAQALVEDA